MKIITEPKVHVLTTTQFHPHPNYSLPPWQNHAENTIAFAGKTCYDSFNGKGRAIRPHIENLIEQEHGSVLEHVNVGLMIEGISRGCSHEIVRHRHFSYSQRSTRYVDESEGGLVSPVRPDGKCLIDQEYADTAGGLYSSIVQEIVSLIPDGMHPTEKRKYARGLARQALPHCLETKLVMTGNLRAWRAFLEARMHPSAEGEIRRLAGKILEALKPIAPSVFDTSKGWPLEGKKKV